jgi:hypothetical protein
MKHIQTFESFLNEAQLNEELNEAEEHNGITQLGPNTLTYWDTGDPNERMPLYDILVALKDHFKMSKKEFPIDKQEYALYSRASGNKGEVKLPNGCRLWWQKSTPPNKYMNIEGDPNAISEIKKLLEKIIKTKI